MTARKTAARRVTAALAAAAVAFSGAVLLAPSASAAVTVGTISVQDGPGDVVRFNETSASVSGFSFIASATEATDTLTLTLDGNATWAAAPTVSIGGNRAANVTGQGTATLVVTPQVRPFTNALVQVSNVRVNTTVADLGGVDLEVGTGEESEPVTNYFYVTKATVSVPESTIQANSSLSTTYQSAGNITVNVRQAALESEDLTVAFTGNVGGALGTGPDGQVSVTYPNGTTAWVTPVGLTVTFPAQAAGNYIIRGLAVTGLGSATGTINATLISSAEGDSELVPSGATVESATVIRVAAASDSRIGGVDRFATSAQVAVRFWREDNTSGNTAIIVNGEEGRGGADALAASYLAGVVNGPALLVGTNAVSASVQVALASQARNITGGNFNTIYVLGDENAVSENVVDILENYVSFADQVERIAGVNRFATAAAVAEEGTVGSFEPSATSGSRKTAFLANGWTPVDALVAGPLAYDEGLPVLLSDGSSLSSETIAAIQEQDITHVIVLGDTNAVSASVVTALEAVRVDGVSVTTQRLGGATRFDTAKLVNDLAIADLNDYGFNRVVDTTYLANAWGFADALTAGPLAGKWGGVVAPTDTDTLSGATATFLTENRNDIDTVVALGQTNRVSAAVLTAAIAAAR